MAKSTSMWAPMLFIGLGSGVGVLAPAIDALWLLLVAVVLVLVGGTLFYLNMQGS